MECQTSKGYKKCVNIEFAGEEGLVERGRVQYFYHCPSSELPIRDVLNEQQMGFKREPHIEIGAENYWGGCYQRNNIIPFIKSNEKYLFLMTTCRNNNLKTFYGKKIIVGYIIRQYVNKNAEGIYFVKGSVKLVSFTDALPLSELGYSKNTRMLLIAEDGAKRILEHFKNKKNILEECIREIKRLDSSNLTCTRVNQGKKCVFVNECRRWKQ